MSLHRIMTAVGWLMISALLTASAWGQRDLKDIPDPDPELERKSFLVAEGFEVNLFAADPLLAKPIQMNFDERGRLWIASSEVYPHIKPGQIANDKILVLEDTDGDGKADKTTVFADGLLIPTGVVPGDGGAYVVNSTELLHLRDTDGDGQADERRVVLSGFGSEDTHHLLHTLRWGPDGALYMNQSIYIHSHIETPYGVRRLNGGGIWRFRPDTLELDIVCRGFVNPWGHHFDRWGQSFATDGAYGEGINYVFPGAVYVTAPGAKRRLLGLNPGSPKHCGLEIVSGRHLPDSWQGNMITNDFRAHRVCRFVVSEEGSGYASRQEVELIRTKHVAFRPIDVKMGTDGAIYIADWYNPIIQHGEVDFRDPRRDHVHGRIWRVTAKERPPAPKTEIATASIADLLDALKSPEQWVRLQAKLQLKQRDRDEVLSQLRDWLAALSADSPEHEPLRLEALWLYQCVNSLNLPLLEQLLQSSDHRVRAAAVRVAVRQRTGVPKRMAYLSRAVDDEHPRVRLEAVRGLAEQGSLEAAQLALRALDRKMDRFLDFALWQTMRDLEPAWLPALRAGKTDLGGKSAHLLFALKAVESADVVDPLVALIKDNRIAADRLGETLVLIAALGGPKQLGDVFKMVVQPARTQLKTDQQAALLRALVRTSQQRNVRPAGNLASLDRLLKSPDANLQAAAASAAGTWNLAEFRPQLEAWASGRQKVAGNVRAASIDAVARLGGPTSIKTIQPLANDPQLSPGTRAQAIASLVQLDLQRGAEACVRWLVQPPATTSEVNPLPVLLRQKQGPAAFVAALQSVRLEADAARRAIRTVQASSQPSPELIAALTRAGSLSEKGWKWTPELSAALVQEVRTKGDAIRGEAVYRQKPLGCLKCHAIGGVGGRVGPDMVSIGASAQIDYLIESLLAPNAKVKENFHSLVVVDEKGRVTAGIPVRDTAQELVLRDAEDREIVIPADQIDERSEGRSLMPEGLVNPLTRQELVDLVKFLSELGKVGPYAPPSAQLVRRWQVLLPTEQARYRIRRSSFDTAASNDPAFTWQAAYATVSGELPVADLPGMVNPTYVTREQEYRIAFVRCEIETSAAGPVGLQLNHADALQLWVDGKPTPLKARSQIDLDAGRHVLTWAVNQDARKTPLQLKIVDIPDSDARARAVTGN